MKTNFHTHILSILILIGFIPKSKLQMIIVGFVSYLMACVAVANHFIHVYFNPIDFDIFEFFQFTNSIMFTFVGLLCPFLNYAMRKRLPFASGYMKGIKSKFYIDNKCINFLLFKVLHRNTF